MSLLAQLQRDSLAAFREAARLSSGGVRRLPVVRTLSSDLHTPVSVYLRLRSRSSHSFLFESVEGGENLARYSFVGSRPVALLRAWGRHVELEILQGPEAGEVTIHEDDPRNVLRDLVERAPLVDAPDLPRFLGGAVGFFAYDSVRLAEDIPRNNPDPLGTPDINLALHDELVAAQRKLLRLARANARVHATLIRRSQATAAAEQRRKLTAAAAERIRRRDAQAKLASTTKKSHKRQSAPPRPPGI